MTDIQVNNSAKKHGVRCSVKKSTKVDLTPMVDLGFLLITFFIFTTTLSESKAMGVVVPTNEKVKDSLTISASKTLQLILGENEVFYYMGNQTHSMQPTSYSASGIRTIIQQRQKEIAEKYGSISEMIVCIKPLESSAYKHLVDVLDEMTINNIGKYILMDATSYDEQFVIQKHN